MSRTELRNGSRNGDVRVLQQLVSEAEHARPGLARDGVFGPLTEAAVLRFQRSRGLEVDGVVGDETWMALGAALHLPQLAAPDPDAASKPQPPGTGASPPAPGKPSTAAPQPRPATAAPPKPGVPATPAPAPTHPPTHADQLSPTAEPRWFQVALAEFQAHHTIFGTVDGNQRIHEYFMATSYHPGVGTHEAWCSAFANWCMRQAGLQGTNLASAASWLNWGVELKTPRHGCVMVIHWAGSHSGSGNHVTFFDHASGDQIFYFGGNQTHQHQISLSQAPRRAMASVHYRWPKGGASVKGAFLDLAFTTYLALAVVSAPVARPDDTFEPFWTGFRQAVLQNDMGKLAALTRLPLQVGFEDDQDHARTVSRAAFPSYFAAELKCPSADGDTNAAMIRRKVQPTGRFDFHDSHRATVGMFSFTRVADGWRLTLLNSGDVSEYRSLLHGRCS